MLKIDFSKLVICTVSFGQTVIHLHTFILQNLLVLLIFQYKSLFGSGLSKLGMNNKYSLVVNRIRLLNEERRKIFSIAGNRCLNVEENVRLESLSTQLTGLSSRVGLVKNAVLSYTFAVALFVLTSLFIGIEYELSKESLNYITMFLFLFGMLSVLIGVVYAAYETKKGHDIIQFELKADE